MNTTLPEPIDSPMKREVQRNLLKWAAGHVMFCPVCGDVMDCRRTVTAEFQYRVPGQDWKAWDVRGATWTGCAKCWDAGRKKYDDALAKLKTRTSEEWQLEIIDGREVFGRGKK